MNSLCSWATGEYSHTWWKIISIKIQQTTYGTHIYLICIVYVHFSLCHNYPYDILVHIHAGKIATCTEQRLSECMEKAWDKKETAEAECDLVKEKARELK